MGQANLFLDELKHTSAFSYLTNVVSLVVEKLAPNWFYHKFQDQLLIPKTNHQNFKIPRDIKTFKIKTGNGELRGYEQGQGPTVLLVHGWSGSAAQFFPLMRGLAQCGFKAVAIDHDAHGLSESKHASLHRFISATNVVLQYLEKHNPLDKPVAIVGHAMGCMAIANARENLVKDISLLLISPIFNFRQYFTKQVNLLPLHPDLSKKYLAQLEQSYLKDLDKMELGRKLKAYATDTVIVHDKTDEESSYIESVKFCSDNPLTKLQITRGYGHYRIINSESLWQQLKSVLNYEDITAHRFQKCS